jgi:hypothetical protein
MTERGSRDRYEDRYDTPHGRRGVERYEAGYEGEVEAGYGYAEPDDEFEERGRRVAPGLFFLAIAVVGSVAFMAYVVTVREATQIPLLATGAVILAIVFAASAAYCLRSVLRSGLQRGRGGRTMLTAIVGGLAAIAAAGFGAMAIIGFMASRPA